jgi:NADH-quinone oxidoreductase subunit G
MIIEVADEAGIRMPRFCYHKKLPIAANCRMCLVEVEKMPEAAAGLRHAGDGRHEGPHPVPAALDRASRATMEFLLINHPLDCPICDQGGECELQDVSMGYGRSCRATTSASASCRQGHRSAGETEMTRCIHCTRCIRVSARVAGVRELGGTGAASTWSSAPYDEQAAGERAVGQRHRRVPGRRADREAVRALPRAGMGIPCSIHSSVPRMTASAPTSSCTCTTGG